MIRKYLSHRLGLLPVCLVGILYASAYAQPAEQTTPQPTLQSPPQSTPQPPPQSTPQPPPQTALQTIEKALIQKGTFEFADVRLSEFVSMLRDKYGMNVVIDYRALREKGIEADLPLSIKLKDVSVSSALELAIRPYDLNWTIYCESLIISTPAAIQKMQSARVYDITDLAISVNEQGKAVEDSEALIQLITNVISPESWETANNRGTIQLASSGAAKMIVVTQDYRVQRQIAQLLADLRDAAKQRQPVAREKTPPPTSR